MRPFSVALTGGIASGKSAVSDRFEQLGAAIIDTDLLAREVVAAGSAGLQEIVEAFGNEVLGADGKLDRGSLRKIVFASPGHRRRLEAITHPRIHALVESRLRAVSAAYAVIVVPLLVENFESYRWADRVLVVDVDRQTQLSRLLQRDGIDLELASAMIAAQASREQRLAIADDILTNEGTLADLNAAVAALDQKYRACAQASD